jgi:hypothetical protein
MRTFLATLAVAALAAACANPFHAYDLQPGATRQEALERLGRPTRIVPIPGGERLQYSLQPHGHYAWMVDLDASGRVVSSRQVLNAADFNRIAVGQWTRQDIEREFGPPMMITGVGNWDGPVMTWRWRDIARADMFMHAFLDRNGVVQRWSQAMEYVNAPNDRE